MAWKFGVLSSWPHFCPARQPQPRCRSSWAFDTLACKGGIVVPPLTRSLQVRRQPKRHSESGHTQAALCNPNGVIYLLAFQGKTETEGQGALPGTRARSKIQTPGPRRNEYLLGGDPGLSCLIKARHGEDPLE